MSKPPSAPYPPDFDDETPAGPTDFGDLADAAVADLDWAGERGLGFEARRVEFRRCRLTGADLAEGILRDVTFDECRLDLVGLRHATLERVVFSDCRMSECDLYGATLKDVRFERCDLREATLSGARLERVDLRACELDGLRGVEALRGARLPWNDVLQNAGLFASVLGIETLVDD